ncbi:MAG TPA: hypothetical protein VEB19_15580 [Gemmatimonadaceae bacterium]|nr:hypothetical protein [Gemmatimonadaceae bacterium]
MRRFSCVGLALLAACSGKVVAPTSSAVLVVRGSITQGGSAQPAALVRARSSPASDCSGGNPYLNAFAESQSSATGAFQFVVPSTAAGPRCVRVVAYAGQPGVSDSSFKTGLFATFKEDAPPDTLTVNLELP